MCLIWAYGTIQTMLKTHGKTHNLERRGGVVSYTDPYVCPLNLNGIFDVYPTFRRKLKPCSFYPTIHHFINSDK